MRASLTYGVYSYWAPSSQPRHLLHTDWALRLVQRAKPRTASVNLIFVAKADRHADFRRFSQSRQVRFS